MKKWKGLLVKFCVVVLSTVLLETWGIMDFGKEKTVRAEADIYDTIKVDGVLWEYTTYEVDISQNKKHQNSGSQNIKTCVKIRLVDTNAHTEITIPDTIEGCPVYRIEQGSAEVNSISKLTIPITVEWIDKKAFLNWNSLKEVRFLDKGYLDSTGKEIQEEQMYLYHIGDEAFSGCLTLVDIPIKETIFSEEANANIGEGIYKNCRGIKKVNISSTKEKAHIPKYTFAQCNLEEGIKVAENIEELVIGEYAFKESAMKKLEISCDCSIETGAFQENKELNCAIFQGNVQMEGNQIFKNAFLVDGEANLVFAGEETVLGKYALSYSNVDTISFEHPQGDVSLGYRCVFESSVRDIKIKNKNITVKEGGLENGNRNMTKIVFGNSGTVFLSDGAFYSFLSFCEKRIYPAIQSIEFQCKDVIYTDLSIDFLQNWRRTEIFENTQIIYGQNVEQVSGALGVFVSAFSAVYIENPMTIHTAVFTTLNPKIYGYVQHEDISPAFESIQKDGLILTYEESEIINTRGMELEKLHVYTVLKTGKQIEIPTGRIIKEGENLDTQSEQGYLVKYEEKLENFEGNITIRVYYQDTSEGLVLPVVSRKETNMQVEWKENYGNNLIEGQTIDLDKLVGKVMVFYNDGSFCEETSQVLEVKSSTVTAGENTIVVYLKENKDIIATLQCQVRENVIQRVVAYYCEEEVFVGDIVDISKIKLKPIYALEDESKEQSIPCKNISKTIFDLEGKNSIRVYYTDELYSDMEVQVKVPQIIKVEAAYKEGYTCYDINGVINKEAIEVRVTLENQKVLNNAQLGHDYDIRIVSCTEDTLTAMVTYQGVDSDVFQIPIEKIIRDSDCSNPKEDKNNNDTYIEEKDTVVAICPILQKDSVLEGDIVGKELISSLRLIYKSGSSKLVGLNDLDPNLLQVSKGYWAVAGQWNEMTITYMGICCKVAVWGEKKKIVPSGSSESDGIQEENSPLSKPQSRIAIKSSDRKIKVSKKAIYTVQTNKAVKITLKTENISKVQYQFVVKGEKINAKQWKNVKNNCICVKNTKEKYGILYIRYTLPNGTVETIHTTGFCMDTTAPKANIKKNQSYTTGKKLTFSDVYGVKWAKLDGKKIKYGTKVKTKGKHMLVIMDIAGNKIRIPFTIR